MHDEDGATQTTSIPADQTLTAGRPARSGYPTRTRYEEEA